MAAMSNKESKEKAKEGAKDALTKKMEAKKVAEMERAELKIKALDEALKSGDLSEDQKKETEEQLRVAGMEYEKIDAKYATKLALSEEAEEIYREHQDDPGTKPPDSMELV